MNRSIQAIILSCLVAAPWLAAGATPALAASPAANGEQFLMWTEPPGAIGVIAVRKEARDQEDVVVVGRIGGKKVPGSAAWRRS